MKTSLKTKIKTTIKILIGLLLLWIIVHITYSIIDGLSDNGESADIVVILGSKVNEDGTLSARLEKRLECGLSIYKAGRVKKIIVSGGLGHEGYYEGEKMQEYLIKKGVPKSDIIVDNYGNNTSATIENTVKIVDSLNYSSIIVVSQYFHLTRTKMLLKKTKIKNVNSVSPRYFEARDIYSIFREFVAFYSQL